MPLTRDAVVDTALRLLDQGGFAEVTMRRIAAELGVQPGALYHHVRNKQQLLADVAHRVLATVDPAGEGAAAREPRAWAEDLRAALLAHREAGEVVASVLAMRPPDLDPTRGLLRWLVSRGMTPERSQAVAHTMLCFVMGHVIDEQNHRLFVQLGAIPGSRDEHFDASFTAGLDLLTAAL